MKTKTLRRDSVNVITLGCSKNTYDSEVLMGQLHANGISVEHESKEEGANIVVVNTCGFIDVAKQESIDTILRFAEAKSDGLIEKLYVTGCLSERYKQDLETEIPEVDAYFGTFELPQLLKKLGADYKHELIGERLLSTPNHYAYLKISEGCNRPCAFCAIPLMRGKHVSRPEDELVREAERLVSLGVKEIILIAQDLTYYGLDMTNERTLARLLDRLARVPGLRWLRLQYAYPSQFPLDVLPIMAEHATICNYMDMPLQHASDRMLKMMRRGITARRTQEVIDTIRTALPELAFRTTLITGFPGETVEDHLDLLTFIERNRFERLGVFEYSHEENTAAYVLEDDVPAEEKSARAAEIMSVQQGISNEINQLRVGKTLPVLFDRKEGGFWVGRTEWDSPEVDNEVLVDAKAFHAAPGMMANVLITSAEDFDLYGNIVA
jgi:ribosomal protein S12 methylthiotransferase